MPVPKPSSGEQEGEFVSRCISTLTNTGEFESDAQRQAVCHTAWRDAKSLPEPSSKGRKGMMNYFRLRKKPGTPNMPANRPTADTQLIYREGFKPRVTEQDNGKFTVHRVPIFMEHDDRGWDCDAEWMRGAVKKQQQNSKKGFLPRLFVGHTDKDNPNEKPVVAFLDNFTHSTSTGTLYADFTDVPSELIEQFKDNNWPGRSAEVFPEEHEITAVALLGGTPPFFKLPDLQLNSKRKHAGAPVLYAMEVKTMSDKNKKGTQYMDEATREEVVQIVDEAVAPIVEKLDKVLSSEQFAGHGDDDKKKNPEHNALHDPEEDARKKREEEDAKKMANSKIAEKYDKLQKNNDALTTRLVELEDANERGSWARQYAEERIPAGRLDIKEHVDFIMSMPSALRETYFSKSLKNLQGPATEATHLADAAQAAGCGKGSVGEAQAISQFYQENKDRFGGDMMAATREYRVQLAQGNGKD